MRISKMLMLAAVLALCGLVPAKASAQCHPVYPTARYYVVYPGHYPRHYHHPHAHRYYYDVHSHSHSYYDDDDRPRRHRRGHRDSHRRRWRDDD